MKKLIFGYKIWAGISAGYVTHKLLEKSTDDLVAEGNAVNAFTVGAGQMGISMAVGVAVAEILGWAIHN